MQPHRMSQVGIVAFASFSLCGICAGFLSALVFFQNRSSKPGDE
jgi:hypothetical protein